MNPPDTPAPSRRQLAAGMTLGALATALGPPAAAQGTTPGTAPAGAQNPVTEYP